jgi:hypothetical protein
VRLVCLFLSGERINFEAMRLIGARRNEELVDFDRN